MYLLIEMISATMPLVPEIDYITYQEQAWKTALYPQAGQGFLTYPVLLLVGEVAEFISRAEESGPDPVIQTQKLQKELGDILWALAAAATELGIPLSTWFVACGSGVENPLPSLQQAAGHLAGLVSKEFRDGLYADRQTRVQPLGQQIAAACQSLCDHFGWDLAQVMHLNIAKLKDRQSRGVLQGEGDER